MKRSACLLLPFVVLASLLAGCGTQTKNVKLEEGYQCPKDTKIEVPPAKNATGKTFAEIDVEKVLTEELIKALSEEGICADNVYTGYHLLLPCRIAEYQPGDAFKRWLMPGYGSTVLDVKCELLEHGNDKPVGTAEARHTVDAGGGYTIGAWKYIFGNLSKEIAKEVKAKIQK